MPSTERNGRKKKEGGEWLMGISWQGILFGIALIIAGLAIATGHSEPVWFYPATGLAFVSGGILSFVVVAKN